MVRTLKFSRDSLFSMHKHSLDTHPVGLNIFLSKRGIILFKWYFKDFHPFGTIKRLPTYHIVCSLLGILDLIFQFYKNLNYLQRIKVIFSINKLMILIIF